MDTESLENPFFAERRAENHQRIKKDVEDHAHDRHEARKPWDADRDQQLVAKKRQRRRDAAEKPHIHVQGSVQLIGDL